MPDPHFHYYLHNFQRALEWVALRYDDLLDDDDRLFLARFEALPEPARALFVRVAMRRGPWFRASRLAYKEIPDTAAAVAPLVALGWLDPAAPMTLDELFQLCTLPELRALFAAQAAAGLRKAQLLQALRPGRTDARPYAEWRNADAEPAWRFMQGARCDRLRLLFFGNLRQDWSEFVLADLGVYRYETVQFDAASRVFQSRTDVDHYLALHACSQTLEAGAPASALIATVPARASNNPWLAQRRDKLLLRMGLACERAQDWDAALGLYAQCAYPGARHRRIRVLERTGRHAEGLALALQAQAAPENDAESQRLARMLPRLRRNTGQAPLPRHAQAAPARLDLTLPRPCPPQAVEYVVRAHLHRDDAPVYYVENALINSLFGLLCWQAVYAPLPGAFFHPFQRGPADLDAPDFATRRADIFAACLAQLDTDAYRHTIVRRYAEKFGVQSPFVTWSALSEPLLHLALACLPAAHLKLFFLRLLQDVRGNRCRLPDLIRFWPAERRYELVEIKGPGDKLQDNQVRWMHYCALHGIPARVCHVSWREDA